MGMTFTRRTGTLLVSMVLALLLASMLVTNTTHGMEAKHTDKAEVLRELGLFQGTNTGFQLERKPTRVEGAVMLVRLLGLEETALSSQYDHPFQDVPSWADAYIGYMYEHNLTKGKSAFLFGSDDDNTAAQYMTFVLRALGYDDSAGDFHWETSIEKAIEVSLINAEVGQSLNAHVFLRDDVVNVSYQALSTPLKGEGKTLWGKLAEDGAIASELVAKYDKQFTGVVTGNEISDEELEANGAQLIEAVEQQNTGQVLTLLRQGVDQENLQSAFYAASKAEYIEGVKALLQFGAEPGGIFWPIYWENYELVKILLEAGADPEGSEHDYHLHRAVSWRNKDIVELLLQHGADPNRGETSSFDFPTNYPLTYALKEMELGKEDREGNRYRKNYPIDMEIVELLLKYGAKPDSTTVSVENFVYLIPTGHLEAVELFLDWGADPNGVHYDLPVLEMAIRWHTNEKGKDIIRLLLEAGAQPTADQQRILNDIL